MTRFAAPLLTISVFFGAVFLSSHARAQPLEQGFALGAPPDVLGNRDYGRVRALRARAAQRRAVAQSRRLGRVSVRPRRSYESHVR